jgi:septum formation protein
MNIILGSSSTYRKDILAKAGYTFDVISPDIDEKAVRSDDLHMLPLLIAEAKMDALIPKIAEAKISAPTLVITSDQIVICGGALREKPKDEEEAREFLRAYSSGKPAETVVAVVVLNTETGKRVSGADTAQVYYNTIPESVIEDFIKNGNALANSGGFAIESPILKPYINKVEGTEESVMGLPIHLVEELMEQAKLG